MYPVFFDKRFNGHELGEIERKKFDAIIEDLTKTGGSQQGNIELIAANKIRVLCARLSHKGRVLFTQTTDRDSPAFVMLKVLPNHNYEELDKIKRIEKLRWHRESEKIEVTDPEVSKVTLSPLERGHWLGKLIIFSAEQEEIVQENHNLPLVVSGHAGSGKTSVALEKAKKIAEKGGKILYISQSKRLVETSKTLYGLHKEGILGEIDFLSLHEWIETLTQKDQTLKPHIEGKKPIDRSFFFAWFSKVSKKEKYKVFQKEGEKLFEEFIGVLGGGGLDKEQTEQEYIELGINQSIFPQNKRKEVYLLFLEYKAVIAKDLNYYDPNFIAHQCLCKEPLMHQMQIYDAVIVDEVQDFTNSLLYFLLKSLKEENKDQFLLCGDPNQVIHPSFFSQAKLQHFLKSHPTRPLLNVCLFKKNYRNSDQIAEVAKRILHLKNTWFSSEDKMTDNQKSHFFMKQEGATQGQVLFLDESHAGAIAKGSIDWAVLILDDEHREHAHQLFQTPLVFTVQEAKGLEFKHVILYKFMANKSYSNQMSHIKQLAQKKSKAEEIVRDVRASFNMGRLNLSRPKNKNIKFFEGHKFYINALYVAVTRAHLNLYIVDDPKRRLFWKLVEPEQKVGHKERIDLREKESSSEEWKTLGLNLIENENIQQVKQIIERLLEKGQQGYAQDLQRALQKKGHTNPSEKLEDRLKLKTKQPLSQSFIASAGPSGEVHKKRPSENRVKIRDAVEDEAKESMRKSLKKIVSKDSIDRFKKKVEEENLYHLFEKEELLALSVEQNRLNITYYLIKEGARLGVQNQKGFTPLHVAIIQSQTKMAKLLIKNGAPLDVQDQERMTPLHWAIFRNQEQIVELLIEKGANLDVKDEKAITPLHLAIGYNQKESAKRLIEKGANLNVRNQEGQLTPLHLAISCRQKEIAELLIRKGANLEMKDQKNLTPLHWAIFCDQKEILERLIEKGANLNAQNQKDPTLLHFAASLGQKAITKLLIEKGAHVNAQDQEGLTPLHFALIHDQPATAKLLIEKGANLEVKDL